MTDIDDVKTTLDKLSDWVKQQGTAQQDRGVPWSLIAGFVIAAIALIGLGIARWKAKKQGELIAKLKHERDVAERIKEMGELSEQITNSSAKIALLRARGKIAAQLITTIDEALTEVQDHATKTRANIDALTNWRDVDRYLSADSDDPS
jgi:uncharacterized coiled-coil protein SlyX